mmetsp:Transcript_12640/g.18426  ORF Transcript_12640/g.18426 Transcript_12640/m.18426 type:complete len:725 (+) Transcript_12640:14-2188(+)
MQETSMDIECNRDAMPEDWNSDKTAESISPEIQESKTSHCVICEKTSGKLLSRGVSSGKKVHERCMERAGCCVCGVEGMSVLCSWGSCKKVFHPHCMALFYGQSKSGVCPRHLGKRESNRSAFPRQVASRVASNEAAVKSVRAKLGDFKTTGVCSGQFFWYVVGTQYFPPVACTEMPEFRAGESTVLNYPQLPGTEDYVECLLAKYFAQTERLQKRNEQLWASVEQGVLRKQWVKNEEEAVVAFVKDLSRKAVYEEYLQHYEKRAKKDPEVPTQTEKKSSGLRGPPKCEEDFVCGVCGDGDYEDDDLIVICEKCYMGAHMKCYGIPVVPEGEWVCDACQWQPQRRHHVKCALCTVEGGAVKPTQHWTSPEQSFPNYAFSGTPEAVWVHVFCAVHLGPSAFKDTTYMSQIDLGAVDSNRFKLKCEVCGTKNGACLQCQHGRCQSAFHPECAKDLFVNTRKKSEYDEVKAYCSQHKPLKLRRVLENTDKQTAEDVLVFCKEFERAETAQSNEVKKLGKRCRKTVSTLNYQEKFQLIQLAEEQLETVQEEKGFGFSVKMNSANRRLRTQVEVQRPKFYNLLHPSAFEHFKLCLPGKVPEVCKLYYEKVYSTLLKELKACNQQPSVYSSKSKKRSKKKAKFQLVEVQVPSLENKTTEETYCVCNQPFVEMSAILPGETETEYQERLKQTAMIGCDNCEGWFHLSCMGLLPEDTPHSFLCPQCKHNPLN